MSDLGPSQNEEEQAVNQGFSCTSCRIPDPCPLGLLVQNVYAKFFLGLLFIATLGSKGCYAFNKIKVQKGEFLLI